MRRVNRSLKNVLRRVNRSSKNVQRRVRRVNRSSKNVLRRVRRVNRSLKNVLRRVRRAKFAYQQIDVDRKKQSVTMLNSSINSQNLLKVLFFTLDFRGFFGG